MKTTVWSIFLVLSVACAEPSFVGLLGTSEGMLFLVTPSESASTRWLKIGESVEGYRLVEYKSKEEVLIVKKDNRDVPLPLKFSKVSEGPAEVSESVILETAKKLVIQRERWESDVTWEVSKRGGNWYVIATKSFGTTKEIRRVKITLRGVPTDYTYFRAVE